MPRILILKFPYSSVFGGGEKQTLELSENLINLGYSVYLVSTCKVLLREFQKRNWPAKKTWAGVEPVTKWSLALFLIIWPLILLNLCRILIFYKIKHQINIIYCLSLTEKILLTIPAKVLGIKIIWVEHLLIENWLLLSPLKYFYVWLSKYVLIITVVNAVKDQLLKLGIKENNIKVIYNSIDVKLFPAAPSDPNKFSKEFVVGFVGRINQEKGLKYLLLAIAKIKNIIPQIKLIIVGEGPQKNSLQMIIKDKQISEQVMFVGFQTDTAKWISHFDCLVLPSTRRETFGIVVAEALACEKPVIVSNVGGLAEVVEDCGYVVEPHHSSNIADALINIYKNYEQALAKARQGRARVMNNFSQDQMISNYVQIFKQIL